MADPLSIVSGVAAVLGVCTKVGWALKEFYDGVSIVDAKAQGLITEVESFASILQLMKDTLEQDKIRISFQATGFISNLWNSLATSIWDSQTTIIQLQRILEKANKTVHPFDATRKHLRLKGAAEEIGIYQNQIRSYRETLQLSLQTVVFWNQVTLQESTDRISPDLDELNNAIRRIARDIHSSIESLRNSVESTKTKDDIRVLSNLENCIRSSASVVSSTSTIVGNGTEGHNSRQYGSDFGDVFPSQPGEMLSRWATSSTILEFEEPHNSHSQTALRPSAGAPLSSVHEGVEAEDDTIDSDTELEEVTVLALLKRGKQRLAEKDFPAADRHFLSCLNRLSAIGPSISAKRVLKINSEVTPLLLVSYCLQKKLDAAQSLLMERITNPPDPQNSDEILYYMFSLVEVLFGKSAYSEALLYGRRALKGYWKLGSNGLSGVQNVLKLLIRVCHADGNYEEEDAYTAILAEFEERNASRRMEEGLPHSGIVNASQLPEAIRTASAPSYESDPFSDESPPTVSQPPEVIRTASAPSYARDIFSEGNESPLTISQPLSEAKPISEVKSYHDWDAIFAKVESRPTVSQPPPEAKPTSEVKGYHGWDAILAKFDSHEAENSTPEESMKSFAETDSRSPRRERQQVGNGLSFKDLTQSMKLEGSQRQKSDPNVLSTRPLSAATSTPPGDQSTPQRFRFTADEFLNPPVPAYSDTSKTSAGGDIMSPGGSSGVAATPRYLSNLVRSWGKKKTNR